MKSWLELYLSFFKMGIVTFGGGYAMLPILQRELVERKKWISGEELLDYYAVSQGLPGIIAINVSVFIGYRRRKFPGATAAALGCVTPSLLIITLIAACLRNFQGNLYVQYALHGIAVCVAAMIFSAVMDFWKKGVRDIYGAVICVVTFLCTLLTDASPVLYVLSAALLGIVIKSLRGGKASC